MALFGCDFLKFLDWHVVLPTTENETTVFNEWHQQKEPLELRDKIFEKNLKKAIEEVQ